ncbi:AtpZ/AtpI family protein [Polaribacter vadi]|uniref:AtpZ/AtpI family protein n=1 Tax=Polaribacter vadi TaxID=1774273 RepID=UPI0030EB6936|tara:strand:+ start:88542 stop:88769 length:228 start_codon:yes stop_codon:yes gene_type:complete
MEKNQKKKETKKPLNKAIQLSGAGLQMGLTIYLGFLLGEWLDAKFETTYLEQTITLVAIFISIYLLIRQAKKIND